MTDPGRRSLWRLARLAAAYLVLMVCLLLCVLFELVCAARVLAPAHDRLGLAYAAGRTVICLGALALLMRLHWLLDELRQRLRAERRWPFDQKDD